MFATTLEAFGGNLDALLKQDWPHLLRDRLGLAHWPSTLGKPLPVALMCYSLDEVRQGQNTGHRQRCYRQLRPPHCAGC